MRNVVVNRYTLCGAVALLWSCTAQAIVNIEGMRDQATGPGLSGTLNLSVSGANGNTEKFATSAGVHLLWRHTRASTLFIASHDYGSSNQVRDTNKSFIHIREVVPHSERFAYEGFVQGERNEFTRLSLRTLFGAGVRMRLHGNDVGATWLGTGAFHSTEKLEDNPLYSDGGTERLWRGNIYLAIAYHLHNNISVESTSYYQPALSDTGDYRLLEQASVRFTINNHLSLRLTLDINHDSRPPESVKQTDVNYLSGLEYSF